MSNVEIGQNEQLNSKNFLVNGSVKDNDFFHSSPKDPVQGHRIASAKEFQGNQIGIQRRFLNNQHKSQMNFG